MTVAERREREKRGRRESIMAGARELFEESGLQATTIDRIAESTELGKGTIYNYFQGKEDIYFQLLMGSLEHLKEELEAVLAGSSDGDLVEGTVEAFARFHRRRHGLNEFLLLNIDDFAGKLPTELVERHQMLLNRVLTLLEELSVRLAGNSGIELENSRDVALFLFAVEIGVSALIRLGRERFDGSVDAGRLWDTAREMLLDGLINGNNQRRDEGRS